MPDLGALFYQAAREPQRPLDLDAVVTRGAALRRRRTAGRATLALLVAASLVPVLRPGGDALGREQQLAQEPATHPSASTAPPQADRPREAGHGAPPEAAEDGSRATVGPEPQQSPARVRSSPAPARSSRPEAAPVAPGDTTPPPRESCSVRSDDPPEQRTCSFTATADGGYDLTRTVSAAYAGSEGTVTVDRDGRRTTYDVTTFDSCRTGVIEPGDVVMVTLHDRPGFVRVVELGAGRLRGC